MSRKIERENYRVEVYPKGPVAYDLDTCHDIAKQIRRHIDDVGIISVVFDTVATCEHCGYKWTELSNSYNGGCCEKDEEAHTSPLTSEHGQLGVGA